jgi:hypothetical protein
MRKEHAINWAKLALIFTALSGFAVFAGYFGGYLRAGIAIVDTPDKLAATQKEQSDFEHSCETNFAHINWQLKNLNDKLDRLELQNNRKPLPVQKP